MNKLLTTILVVSIAFSIFASFGSAYMYDGMGGGSYNHNSMMGNYGSNYHYGMHNIMTGGNYGHSGMMNGNYGYMHSGTMGRGSFRR